MPQYLLHCASCGWQGEKATLTTSKPPHGNDALQALLDEGCPNCGQFVAVAAAHYASIQLVKHAPPGEPLPKQHNPGHVGCCHANAIADALIQKDNAEAPA